MRWTALLALTLAAVACDDAGEPPLVAEDIMLIHEMSDQIVIGLEHYVSSQGIRRAHVLADTAFFLEGQSGVELRVLTVSFFDNTGALTSILTSRTGTYDWDTGDMTATDSVVVVNPAEGRRIETSVMHYDSLKGRSWSDQPTTMVEADGTVVKGTAFDSDAGITEVNMTSATVQKPDAEQPSLREP